MIGRTETAESTPLPRVTPPPDETGIAPRPPRTVRSFVPRAGRMTRAQQRAWQDLWPRLGVEAADSMLDLDAIFGRRARRTVEIGFGNGEALVALAASRPAEDFLGIEVHRPGVGHLMLRCEELAVAQPSHTQPGCRRCARAAADACLPRRGAALLPRSVAEEAASQAPHRSGRIRGADRIQVADRAAYSVSRPTGNPMRTGCSKRSAAARCYATNRLTADGRRGRRAARRRASSCAASDWDMPSGTSHSGDMTGERARTRNGPAYAASALANAIEDELRSERREQHAEQPTQNRAARDADHAHDRTGHEHQRERDREHQQDHAGSARRTAASRRARL